MSDTGEPDSDVIYCENCGQQMAVTAKFCERCGSERGSTDGTGSTPTNPQSEDSRPEIPPGMSTSGSWTIGRKTTLGASVVAAVGAFLPWISVNIIGTSASLRGIEADGVFTLIFGVAVFITTARSWSAWPRRIVFALGGLTLLLGGIYIYDPLIGVDTTPMQERFSEAITPGIGLYLTAIAGLIIVLSVLYDTWYNTEM